MDKTDGKISLGFYNRNHHSALQKYDLPEDQLCYSGLPIECLKDCLADDKRCPVVILYGSDPAGFMILHKWPGAEPYCKNQRTLLLRAFSVDTHYQHKGIASRALMLLDPFIQTYFVGIDEIVLGVNCRNEVAQHVYIKAGFRDSGKRKEGKHGSMMVLIKALSHAV